MLLRSMRMLEHFLTASRTGTFLAAAQNLGVAPTTISKSIQELETLLGEELFRRTRQGVQLTPFGERFYTTAIEIEKRDTFLAREIVDWKSGQAGTLTIGAGTVWSSVLLPKHLARLSEDRRSARFVVVRSAGSRFREELRRGEIDLGLGLEPGFESADEPLVFEPLARVRTMLLVRRNHPLTDRPAPTLDEIATYPWSMYRLDHAIFEQLRRRFLARGVTLDAPHYLADSISSVMGFVGSSNHVTCLPAPFRTLAVHHGLVELPFDRTPEFFSGATYMRAAAEYPLLRHVLQQIRSQSKALFPDDAQSWLTDPEA